MNVINVAAYKFVSLDQLPERRDRLKALCLEEGLRGSILLAPEGINLFVAGRREAVDCLLENLQADRAIGPLDVKESFADTQPFNRMLVKIKKEIIAFGVEGIFPATHPSKKIAARELRQWLDEGRDLTLLDTRNHYEIELGTFEGAAQLNIDHFRKFPDAVNQLPAETRKRPLVMFCTGGIRCEKAGPLMERLGFEQVYQLDGGILRYFEEVGRSHYSGDCFVFDKRVAVDADLRETDDEFCFACQKVLSAKEQQSPKYVVGESCPYCYTASPMDARVSPSNAPAGTAT